MGGSGQLIIEQTGKESLTITADDNVLPYIRSEVTGSTLRLGLKAPMTHIRPTTRVVYKLTVKELDRLNVSGSGATEAKSLHADRLKIDISGSGKVSAAGDAQALDIDISGSGDYRGEDMQCKRVNIDISGSGSAVVAASDTLDAGVSGSGSIEYIGNPRVDQRISGSGSVRKR
jgi:hypothetical protein